MKLVKLGKVADLIFLNQVWGWGGVEQLRCWESEPNPRLHPWVFGADYVLQGWKKLQGVAVEERVILNPTSYWRSVELVVLEGAGLGLREVRLERTTSLEAWIGKLIPLKSEICLTIALETGVE